jgi:hypothetical protein
MTLMLIQHAFLLKFLNLQCNGADPVAAALAALDAARTAESVARAAETAALDRAAKLRYGALVTDDDERSKSLGCQTLEVFEIGILCSTRKLDK